MLRRPIGWVIPYVMLWYLVGLLPFQPTDLDIFFWPSAKMAIAGQPLMVYAANGQDAYPNANGPVSLLPLGLAGLLRSVRRCPRDILGNLLSMLDGVGGDLRHLRTHL